MNCDELEEDLALSALGVLEEQRLAELRAHTAVCKHCAARLKEYEAACAAQTAALEEIQGLPLRTAKLMPSRAGRIPLRHALARWVLPVTGLGAAAALILLLMRSPKPADEPLPSAPTAVAKVSPATTLAVATLGSYRQALQHNGPSALDWALERDADVLLEPTTLKDFAALREEMF